MNREGDTARPPDSFSWSGRWELNPRPSAWEADALPLSYARPLSRIILRPRRLRPRQLRRGDGYLVHGGIDVEPPHLRGFVDVSLSDAHGVIQPAGPFVLRR